MKLSVPNSAKVRWSLILIALALSACGGETGGETPVDLPVLTIDSASITEGDANTSNGNLNFLVKLSRPSGSNVSVHYSTLEGSASEGDDYLAVDDTLIIPAGTQAATIAVTVNDDSINEGAETLTLSLTDPQGATLANGSATGTIIDNDSLQISVEDARIAEGDTLSTSMVFTVKLTQAAPGNVSVHYATEDISATEGDDYTAIDGTLQILQGESSATISVIIIGDTRVEGTETFSLTLSQPPEGLEIARPKAIGTIDNDDVSELPVVTVDSAFAVEGDDPNTTTDLTFTVNLDRPAVGDVTFRYSIDAAETTALLGEYVSVTPELVTIAENQTSATIVIGIVGDIQVENDETVAIALHDVSPNASLQMPRLVAVGTIKNDDFTLYVDDASVQEGDSGNVELVFTARINNDAVTAITADFATRDGTARVDDADYLSSSGQLVIPPGTSSATVKIEVIGDMRGEGAETLYLDLSNPVGADLAAASATGTIENDDTLVQLSLSAFNLIEGNSGTVTYYQIGVELTQAVASTVTIDYQTENGTAIAESDYEATSGTLSFQPGGSLYQHVAVPVIGDDDNEPDETFVFSLINPTGAGLNPNRSSQTVVIRDDDRPELTIDTPSVVEGDVGSTTDVVFTLTLSEATSIDVTFDYSVGYANDDSATAYSDFNPIKGSGIIPANELSTTITATVNGDAEVELNEKFRLVVQNTIGLSGSSYSSQGTIINDDFPTINVSDISVFEGSTNAAVLKFPIHSSAPISDDIVVNFTVSDGTATAGTESPDYIVDTDTVTIPGGSTMALIPIAIVNDDIEEPDETLTLSLTGVASNNALLGITNATGIIENDDSSAPTANRIHLPATGQLSCYNASGDEVDCAGTGQDAEYHIGQPWPNPRFTDNKDGTITDNLTNLVWAADGNIMPVRDPGWDADDLDDGKVDWYHALDYVAKLNTDPDPYLGHSDWRLPNFNELHSLVNFGAQSWYEWLQGYGFSIESNYWTSTSFSPESAWYIGPDVKPKTLQSVYFQYVVPVRGTLGGSDAVAQTGQTQCYDAAGVIDCAGTGQDGEYQVGIAWPVNRLTANADGTVTDSFTSLVWLADANILSSRDPEWDTDDNTGDGAVTWVHALQYIAKLNAEAYLGHNDWRLPNVNELRSLRNSLNNGVQWLQESGLFSNIQSYSYWSSTTAYQRDKAWMVSTGSASYAAGEKSTYYRDNYVWPVRGGL